jgi:hypothetical protein
MVGGVNTIGTNFVNGYETTIGGRLTASQALRRKSTVDTDNNGNDFEQIDYRTANLTRQSPRKLAYGAWNPVTGVKD